MTTTEPDRQLQAAFTQALERHRAGELEAAEAAYRALLDADPAQPDALHLLGVLRYQRGDGDGAVALIRQALAREAGRAERHNDLGNILFARGEPRQAADCFREAVTLQPFAATLWNNLGAALLGAEAAVDAELAFRQAIALDGAFVDALRNLGHLLDAQGRSVEAAEYHCRAYVLAPPADDPKSLLGIAYYKLGRYAEAAEVYRQWLQQEPGDPVAAHFYAACSGQDVPQRCSEAYIEKTFDDFAAHFDAQLSGLQYRGPEMMAQVLAQAVPPGSRLAVLDAGCGTGLCGPVLAPYAARLSGVDLSARMLEAAAQRGLYQELRKADLIEFLQQTAERFDLIAAADTLIYFGDLAPLFAAARHALSAGGLFAFTVECGDELTAFRLNPNGRYSHSQDYLAAALQTQGFRIEGSVPGALRVEFGTPVNGLALAARKE